MRHLSITLLLVCFACALRAQTATPKITTQQQVWYGYFNNTSFGEKWFLYTELENRQFIEPGAQNLFLLRTHLHYKVHKHWDVAAGFGYFLVTTQIPERKSMFVQPEFRPFVEANNNFTWGVVTLTNRLRFEQRFVRKTAGDFLAEGYNFNMRFRYRIAVDVMLYKSKDKKHALKLKINDEIMFNIPTVVVKNAFDQNRVYAGINYQPPGPMSFEVGYMHWFQERSAGGQYFNRNILRFSVFHKGVFPVNKKKKGGHANF